MYEKEGTPVVPKLARSKTITKQAKKGKSQQDSQKILTGHPSAADSLDADLKASFSTQEECKQPPNQDLPNVSLHEILARNPEGIQNEIGKLFKLILNLVAKALEQSLSEI